jgi:hypothetical protein
MQRLDLANARDAARAERLQARAERREFRIENRLNGAGSANNLGSGGISLPTAGTISVSSHRNSLEPRNTALIYPGQVSTFRTTRPERVSNRSTYLNDNGNEKVLRKGVSLDLSSTVSKITVGSNLINGTVTISVGGETKEISAGDKVTAAEYAALTQKLATGDQGLVLSDKGAATGGALNLNTVSDDGQTIRASALVIPENVSVSGDFARNADGVRVTGDLSNAGAIYAVSTNASKNTAFIGARDINNEGSGLITTDVPNSVSSQYGSTNSTLNLSLHASRDLNNDGAITSSGALDLGAGGSLKNSGLAQSAGNVNIYSSNVTNSGAIASINQNVTVTAPVDSSIYINSTGGSISALNGDINIATVSNANQKLDTTLIGGDWHSNNLNVSSSDGHAFADVGDVTGLVNIKAGIAHFNASTENLRLGQMDISGDPLFSNDVGNLDLSALSLTTAGAPLALVAAGDINAGTATVINTSAVGAGGSLTIVAGAAFTIDGFGSAVITGGSVTGGSINLTGISTLSTQGFSSAGNVSMYAFSGTTVGTGNVFIPGALINAGSSGTGGNITIIANGANIDLTGGIAPLSGDVSITGATPVIGSQFIIDSTGAIVSGVPTAGALSNTTVTIGNSTLAGATRVRTSGDISLGNLTVGSNSAVLEGKDVIAAGINNKGAVTLLAHNNITFVGNKFGAGGLLGLANHDIFSSGAIGLSSGDSFVPTGNIALVAGTTFTNNITDVVTTGASATGGNLNLSTLTQLSTVSGLNSAKSGDLTLVAFAGSGGGQVSLPAGLTTTTGTNGLNGTTGNISIVGSANTGNAVSIGNLGTTGSTPTNGGLVAITVGTPIFGVTFDTTSVTYDNSFSEVIPQSGNIVVGVIDTVPGSNTIIATLGSVTTGNISTGNSTGGSNAGNVQIDAEQGITTGAIIASGTGVAGGGNVVINGGGGSWNVGPIFANGGTAGNGGNVQLNVSRGTTFVTAPVQASATNGAGGTISVSNIGSGGIEIATGKYNVNGSTDGGTLTFDAANGVTPGLISSTSDVVLSVSSGVGAFAGSINVAGNAFNINGTLQVLTTGGSGGQINLTATTNNIFANGSITVAGQGDVTINTAQALSANAASATHDISVTGVGDVIVDAVNTSANVAGQNGGNVAITSTAASVITGTITSNGLGVGTGGNVSLTAFNNITTPSINASGSGTPAIVALTTNNGGNIDVSGVITAPSLTVNISGGSGTATILGNNVVNNITTVGGGSVFFNNTIALNINTISSELFTATSPISVTFQNDFISTGSLTVVTPVVTFNNVDIEVATFIAQNATGSLTVNGGSSTLTATDPSAGSPGFPSDPAAISFLTGPGANLDLFGTMSFNGDVLLSNPGGTTTSHTNSQFIGNNNVTLTTDTWIQQANGNITGNKFIFTGLTIANLDGDVVLTQNITFNGRSLAILSVADILLGNFTINLANASGDGGSLSMLAGVDFELPPPGTQTNQFSSQGLFNNITFNATGGSISGTGTITLTGGGAGGNGGQLTAIANLGSISLTGAIDTTSTNGNGGDVFMIAPNGITTGNITTTGTTFGGSVNLQVATPDFLGTPGPFTAQAGIIGGGLLFPAPGTATVNAITVGTINTGNSAIAMGTAGPINVGGNLTANSYFLSTALDQLITFASINSLTAVADGSGNGGSIQFVGGDIVNSAGAFAINVNGTTGDAGSFLYETGANVIVGTGGDLTISATGLGDGALIDIRTQNNLTISAGGINAAHTAGDGARFFLRAGTDGTGTLELTSTAFLSAANASGVPGDNYFGGTIDLGAKRISYTSSASSPLVLSANGLGLGGGGTISYRNDDGTPTFFGAPKKNPKPPADFLSISATSGSLGGDAGKITVKTGGNITISDTTLIDAHTNSTTLAAGAILNIEAGNLDGKSGFLIINGDLNADSVGGGAGGIITLTSNNKKDFELNNGKLPKNGISGTLSATGPGGRIQTNNLGGGISVNTQAALTADVLDFVMSGKGTISVGKNVVLTASSSIIFVSETGAIGKKPLLVNTGSLNIDTDSSVNIVNQFAGDTFLGMGTQAGKSFKLTTAGGIDIVDLRADDGDVELIAGGGSISVETTVHAVNGGILLNNTDTAAGTIDIGQNARIETSGKGNDIVIAIGTPPKKGTNETPPAGVTVDPEGTKGKAFFGPNNGVVATTVARVEVVNKDVIFSNLSTGANKITLGTDSVVRADPPSRIGAHAVSLIPSQFAMTDTVASLPTSSATVQSSETVSAIGNLSNVFDVPVNLATLNSVNSDNVFSRNVAGGNVLNGNIISGNLLSATVGSDTADVKLFGSAVTTWGTTAPVATSGNDLIVDAKLHVGTSETTTHRIENDKAIFAPTQDTMIETPHGTIKLAAGAVALVMQSPDGLAVYNLHDSHKNSVAINVSDKNVVLSPGRHVHISNQTRGDFADVNPIELVQHRALTQSKLNNGKTVYTSEFSIPSACYAVKSLKTLMTSNDATSKRLAKQIMKTSSVLMYLCPDKGDYVQHFKPTTTAMVAAGK